MRAQKNEVQECACAGSHVTEVNLHEPVAAAKSDGVGIGGAEQQRIAEGREYLQRQLQEVRFAVCVEVWVT